jgi:hypothetical protein
MRRQQDALDAPTRSARSAWLMVASRYNADMILRSMASIWRSLSLMHYMYRYSFIQGW